jgi:hypothetical protein
MDPDKRRGEAVQNEKEIRAESKRRKLNSISQCISAKRRARAINRQLTIYLLICSCLRGDIITIRHHVSGRSGRLWGASTIPLKQELKGMNG